MLKKTLSIILAIAMLCSMIPVVALADGEIIGGADGATDIAVENNAENEVIDDELAAEPLATHDYDTSTLEDIGVPMPATFANIRYTGAEDAAQVATTADLPDSSKLTYMLIDSSVTDGACDESKSNFKAVLPDGTSWQGTSANKANPWLDGVYTRRSSSGSIANASTHTAYIVVPESVGEAGKEFQIVTMNIRTIGVEPDRTKADNTRGIVAWVDDEPVSINGKQAPLGNLRTTAELRNIGRWSNSGGSSYYFWEWGPTVTLTPGVHKIVYKPAGSSVGGRTPGLIVTSAVGYDWTKVSPYPASGYAFEGAVANIRADIAGSFGAAGYIDFAAPAFAEGDEIAADAGAFSAELTWPAVADDSVYGNDKVAYVVECNGKEEYVLGTSASVSGLELNTEYTATVAPMDAVGNKGEAISVTFKTAEKIDFPNFNKGEIKVSYPLKPTEAVRTTKLPLSWSEAVNPVENAVITYALYANGEKKASGITDTSYTLEGLEPGTKYTIKVVIEQDGNELRDSVSAIENSFFTGKPATATLDSVDPWVVVISLGDLFVNQSEHTVYYVAKLTYTDEGGSPKEESVTLSVADGKASISGLKANTEYTAVVTATEKEKKAESSAEKKDTEPAATIMRVVYNAVSFTTGDPFPYFTKDTVNNPKTVSAVYANMPSEAARTTTLPLTWPAAVNETADKVLTYAVYVDGDKAVSGLKFPNYTVTGLTPGTEYAIKVVAEANGEEITDARGILENIFTTGKAATATLSSKTGSSATIALSDIFVNPSDYTVTYSALANGIDFETTVNNGVASISGLAAGTDYTVFITATATNNTTKAVMNIPYPAVTFRTDATGSSEATYASSSILISSTTASEWPIDSGDGNKDDSGWFGPSEVWRTDKGLAAATITVPEDGNFYVITRTFSWSNGGLDSARYFTMAINGTSVGNGFQFGYNGVSRPNAFITSYCPTPIRLTKGTANVTFTKGVSALRVSFILLVPANNIDELNATIAKLTSKEAVLATNDTNYINSSSITTTVLGEDKVMVSWLPNHCAKGDEAVKYEVYLNGALVQTMNWNDRSLLLSENVLSGKNTIKVVAKVGDEVKGTVEKTVNVVLTLPSEVTTTINTEKDKDGKVNNYLQDVSVSIVNKTTESRNLVVMVAVFQNNRIIEKNYVEIALQPGEPLVYDYTLLTNNVQPVKQTDTLDPSKPQVKIFAMDASNSYKPILLNYDVE